MTTNNQKEMNSQQIIDEILKEFDEKFKEERTPIENTKGEFTCKILVSSQNIKQFLVASLSRYNEETVAELNIRIADKIIEARKEILEEVGKELTNELAKIEYDSKGTTELWCKRRDVLEVISKIDKIYSRLQEMSPQDVQQLARIIKVK